MNRKVTITLRLTADEEKILDRVARSLRATRSEALRAVLKDKAKVLEREEKMTVHDRLKQYIPAADGPVKKRSVARNASEEFYNMLKEEHDARRSR